MVALSEVIQSASQLMHVNNHITKGCDAWYHEHVLRYSKALDSHWLLEAVQTL